MLNNEVPVLIVGAGPVGLALAADLGRRGVPALLIERNENKIGPAKMLEVSVRTMEFCRQLGIDTEVHKGPFRTDYPIDNAFVTNMRGFELGRVVIPAHGAQADTTYSPERMRVCPQTWFDPILQRKASSFPHVEFRYNTKLTDFSQDSSVVTANVVEPSGVMATIRAQYMVGCDGFASTVRSLLGIEVRGEKHLEWSMSLYLRIPGFYDAHQMKPAFRYVFVGPAGTWGFINLIDGQDLWRMTVMDRDEQRLKSADPAELVRRAVGCDIPFTLEAKSLWIRKRTVADRFMDGRVFLAGDAAHAHPPNGGLGMNTGIQDAFDLGWKLAANIQGWGGSALLQSYDIERRPASTRATEVSLLNYRRLDDAPRQPELDAVTPAGEAARRSLGERLTRENEKAWNPLGVHLGYIYYPSPIVVSDGTDKPEDDTIGYIPTTFPGARAPHVWIEAGKSILDLFGRGFVLLKFDDVPTESFEAAAAKVKLPLEVHRIKSALASELYQRKLVLVRPDGHVGWRGDSVLEEASHIIEIVRGAAGNIAAQRRMQ